MCPILFAALFANLIALQSLTLPLTDAQGDPLPPGAIARTPCSRASIPSAVAYQTRQRDFLVN
jgi:hypothetical protein